MKTSTDFLYEIAGRWTREEKLKYLMDLSDELLTETCVDRLDLDFSDCETEEQVREKADMNYLQNPLKKVGS